MATLYEPKKDLYGLLSTIDFTIGDVQVYQQRPEVLEELPCITFNVSNNSAILELSKDIGYQEISVTIDFWGSTSKDTGSMLSETDEVLRANGYQLTFSSDIPDPDGEISHITSRFNLIK